MENLNVIKKEVSQKEEQKESKYIFVNSNKVTYKIKKDNECVLHQDKYKNFLAMLEKAEQKLKSKLKFTVQINFLTLIAFDDYKTEEELNTLFDIMGIRIFELIQDISLRKDINKIDIIKSKYIYNSKLKQLREYYDKYNEIVLYSFLKNDYSSLPLFDALYSGVNYSSCINNICKIMKMKKNTLKKKLACVIYNEFMNKNYLLGAEKEIENLYYKINIINDNINKLTNNDIKLLYDFSISSVYNHINGIG